jgi:hypothetical protein
MNENIYITPERLASHCRCSIKTVYRDCRSTVLRVKRFRGVKGIRISLEAANRYISIKHPGMTLLTPETATREPQWCRSLHHDHAHLIDTYGRPLCSANMPLGGVWTPVDGDRGRSCGRCSTELERRAVNHS